MAYTKSNGNVGQSGHYLLLMLYTPGIVAFHGHSNAACPYHGDVSHGSGLIVQNKGVDEGLSCHLARTSIEGH